MITLEQAMALWEGGESDRAAMARRQRYYEGRHDILDRTETWSDGSPKTNLVTNWARYVVDMYTGALTTAPFRVSAEGDGGAAGLEYYAELTEGNGLQAVDIEMLRQCLVHRQGLELHEFRSNPGRHVITIQNPLNWRIVCDDAGAPVVAIRCLRLEEGDVYEGEILEDALDVMTVWDRAEIVDYTRPADTTGWMERARRPHYFGRVPIVVWQTNESKAPLLTDDILGQCDEYNAVDSTAGDNIRDTVDAILGVVGADPEWILEKAVEIRESRVLPVPEGGSVSYIARPSNADPVVTRLQRTREQICMAASVPDISVITGASGSTSGIALRLRFMPMLHRSSGMTHYLRDCVRQRIDLINAIAGKIGRPQITDYTVTIQFVLPHNRTEEWQAIGALNGIVSKRTQLELLSDVPDPEAELKAVMEDLAVTPEALEAATDRAAALMTPFAREALDALSVAVIDALTQSGALDRVAEGKA